MNHNKELKVVILMIDLYYKKQKNNDISREELIEYVTIRQNKCPFKETKTFCSNCIVHCYKEEYKIKIKEVMRYSGPKMIIYHPILAIQHIYYMKKGKRKNG